MPERDHPKNMAALFSISSIGTRKQHKGNPTFDGIQQRLNHPACLA